MQTASTDVVPGTRILVLPLGSFEQHGPHLPLDTDTRIAVAIIESALALVDPAGFMVAPAVPISASDEHRSFPGTLSAGTEATTAYIVGIARSAAWARGICIVNGHGGNVDALESIHHALVHENIPHDIWSPSAGTDDDAHAGCTETSLMLAIDPASVRTDRLEPGTPWTRESAPALNRRMRDGGVGAVAPNGVLGDPRTATARHGADLLERHGRALAGRLARCSDQWPVHRS